MRYIMLLLGLCSLLAVRSMNSKNEWGFYGHRLINRLAIFTLPEEMMRFYKKNMDYLEVHAIDPDKRRYAVKAEAIRHYFDLDHWTHKMDTAYLPKEYAKAVLLLDSIRFQYKNETYQLFDVNSLDTMHVCDTIPFSKHFIRLYNPSANELLFQQYQRWFNTILLPEYDPLHWTMQCDSIGVIQWSNDQPVTIEILDSFSKHGILPYHLRTVYRQLVHSFTSRDAPRILRLSAEIGHYLADAHVPLHTSQNYNGQLTQQTGIHAFWESRLPELFAEKEFDFLVGAASYIDDVSAFTWDIIYQSHQMVTPLLTKEKTLSQAYAFDQQYCYEKRGNTMMLQPCKKYAEAFHKLLDGQVEQRMRCSILCIGSFWMSAWMDAGQPDLDALMETSNGEQDSSAHHNMNDQLAPWVRPHE